MRHVPWAEPDGLGDVPPIADRTVSYTVRQLYNYQQGTRQSQVMRPVVVEAQSGRHHRDRRVSRLAIALGWRVRACRRRRDHSRSQVLKSKRHRPHTLQSQHARAQPARELRPRYTCGNTTKTRHWGRSPMSSRARTIPTIRSCRSFEDRRQRVRSVRQLQALPLADLRSTVSRHAQAVRQARGRGVVDRR